MQQHLLSLPEAALLAGVSRVRVWQLVTAERLPAVRLGNFWYIDPADLAQVAPLKRGRPRKTQVCA